MFWAMISHMMPRISQAQRLMVSIVTGGIHWMNTSPHSSTAQIHAQSEYWKVQCTFPPSSCIRQMLSLNHWNQKDIM